MFLRFANFYRRFIQRFSQIATPVTAILKTSRNTESKTQPGEAKVEIGGSSRAEHDGRRIRIDDDEVDGDEVEVNEVEDDEVGKRVQKLSKSKNLFKSKKIVRSDFFTPRAKLAFTELRQVFVKAPILHHFDPKRHIRIKTDASGYAISGVLNQLTSDNSGRWHLIAFISQKMILAETRYETQDGKLLTIVKAFKTWRHCLEGSRNEVFVLTNHNNLRWFMDTKSLSSKQACWAQKLFCYHF